jgi:Asp-tRNA(Asn)/Glu-tRNA(Gln) amidotransferase A subunit family amidase
MRGFTLRALPVCFVAAVTGCFSTGGAVGPAGGPPPTPTHAYWRQVGAILSQKSTTKEWRDAVALVQRQTAALQELSTEGVDPALASAAAEVIRCEEEVLNVASMFDNNPAELKKNQAMAVTFADANRKASEAKKRLKGLRDALNARLGGGFAPIE